MTPEQAEEEARAAAYREQARRRDRFDALMRARLTPAPGPALALRERWQPVIDGLDDARRLPDGDPEEHQWE